MKNILKIFLFIMILNHQEKLAHAEDAYCYERANLCGLHESVKSCEVYHSPVVRVENVSITFNSISYPALNITSREFYYIPIGIEQKFDKLQCLTIKDSKLKRVRAYNLKPFIYLEYLDLSYNDLLVLEPNLFQHNPNLTQVWLNNNQIYYTDPTALIALKNIKYFNFYNNLCCSFLSRNYTELIVDQNVTLCRKIIPSFYENLTKLHDEFASMTSLMTNNSIYQILSSHDKKCQKLIKFSEKYFIYVAGICILSLIAVNSLFCCCICCYIKSRKTSTERISNRTVGGTYDSVQVPPQSVKPSQEGLFENSQNYEELSDANIDIEAQNEDEELYSEVGTHLENLPSKGENDDEKYEIYAKVSKVNY